TDQERSYLETLKAASRYSIEGDRLVLSATDGAALLTLTRRKALAMNPEHLVGTAWRLESIGGAPPAGRAPITISFPEAGTIRGFAGCRDFVSRYRATGDRIGLSETHMVGTECNAPPAIALQEGDLTTHLSEAEHYVLGEDRLEMTTAAGVVLVFRRIDR
ncbi:MAG TPA: META domain-containing protein, partial [Thermoanaerobaculia bacterium]|nr:META domain-containing protein [Thermoanaerobaculia bacterium]